MKETTNVDQKNKTEEMTISYEEFESSYEMNIIGWDVEGKIKSKTSTTFENPKKREKELGSVIVKAYPGGYKEKEEQIELGK